MRAASKAAQHKVLWNTVANVTCPCSLQPTREKLGKEPSECEEEELASILVRAMYLWNWKWCQTNTAWVGAGKSCQCWHASAHQQGTRWRVKVKHTRPSCAVRVWGHYGHVAENAFPAPRKWLLCASLSQEVQCPPGSTSVALAYHTFYSPEQIRDFKTSPVRPDNFGVSNLIKSKGRALSRKQAVFLKIDQKCFTSSPTNRVIVKICI